MKLGMNNNYGTANFIFHLSDCFNFLILVDLDLTNGSSVTNDIRNVIDSMKDKGYNLKDLKVIYRDSQLTYDAILINPDHSFHSFSPLNEKDLEQAKATYDARIINQQLRRI